LDALRLTDVAAMPIDYDKAMVKLNLIDSFIRATVFAAEN
jgi:hypothetical protein